jgi:hypothetical protein
MHPSRPIMGLATHLPHVKEG